MSDQWEEDRQSRMLEQSSKHSITMPLRLAEEFERLEVELDLVQDELLEALDSLRRESAFLISPNGIAMSPELSLREAYTQLQNGQTNLFELKAGEKQGESLKRLSDACDAVGICVASLAKLNYFASMLNESKSRMADLRKQLYSFAYREASKMGLTVLPGSQLPIRKPSGEQFLLLRESDNEKVVFAPGDGHKVLGRIRPDASLSYLSQFRF